MAIREAVKKSFLNDTAIKAFPPTPRAKRQSEFCQQIKKKTSPNLFSLPSKRFTMALPLRKYFFLWLSDCVTLCAIYTNIQYNISLYNRQFHNSLPRKSARVHWGRELKNDLYVSEHIKEALNY